MVKYIFGHKNPDTDSVVSAILYSNLLSRKGLDVKASVLGELNNETKFIMSKVSVKIPEIIEKLPKETEIILVDHNEKKQTIDNIDELNLIEIIDHHKVNLKTDKPIKIRIEPLGSTASLIYKIFKERGITPSKDEAILIISGILSDTLHFRSPTTTEFDKKTVEELKKIAEIEDIEKFALDMFDAKSNLGNIKTEDLIKLDYKEFEFRGEKYGIGVIETTNPNFVLEKKLEIVEKMKEIKEKDNLKGIIFSIIDILNEENTTIISDEHEAEIIRAVFNGKLVEDYVYSLGPVLSRKKQIVPKIEEYFKE